MPEQYTDTPLLTERYIEALTYALTHHSTQLRKGTSVPYAAHLLAVSALVLEMGGTEDEAIGGLLHDVVEDGGGPAAEAEIRARFGDVVADIVVANSDTDEIPKPPWGARKQAYIDGIGHKSAAALRVSLADKLHNARTIVLAFRSDGSNLWARFNPTADVPWYYRSLADAFARRSDDLGAGGVAALGELQRTVDELERLMAHSRA